LTLHYRHSFGYSLAVPPPHLGERSSAVKLVSEDWDSPLQLRLELSGRPGTAERINLFGAARVAAAAGAQLSPDHHFLTFAIPGQGSDAAHHTIRLQIER